MSLKYRVLYLVRTMITGDAAGREKVTKTHVRLDLAKEVRRDLQLTSPNENDFISGNGWEMCSHCEDITQLSSKMIVL